MMECMEKVKNSITHRNICRTLIQPAPLDDSKGSEEAEGSMACWGKANPAGVRVFLQLWKSWMVMMQRRSFQTLSC